MKPVAWPLLARLTAPLFTRLGALPERERVALLAGGLALLAAVEWFAVLPLLQRHDSIVQAARAEAQAATDAHEAAQQARQQAADELLQRSRRVEAELLQLGAGRINSSGTGGKSGQRLADLLARAMQQPAVRVVALREVGVDEIEAPAAEAPVATAAAEPTAADSGQPAPARVLLYRHRFELSLAGPLPAVLATLGSLEQGLRPLRTEQLKLGPADKGEVQLTLTLVGVGTERAWLSL